MFIETVFCISSFHFLMCFLSLRSSVTMNQCHSMWTAIELHVAISEFKNHILYSGNAIEHRQPTRFYAPAAIKNAYQFRWFFCKINNSRTTDWRLVHMFSTLPVNNINLVIILVFISIWIIASWLDWAVCTRVRRDELNWLTYTNSFNQIKFKIKSFVAQSHDTF